MKRIKSITSFATAMAVCALAGNALAEGPSAKREPATKTAPAPVGEKAALPGTDQNFLQRAAEMNLHEIDMGKTAERISANPQVRKIAQGLVHDHGAALQQLQKLAMSKGVTLPTSINKSQQEKQAAMESKSGEQFDKAYLQEQVQSTQQAISFFEREASRTTDADIKTWAKQRIPGLKNHLAALQTSHPEAVGEKKGKQSPPMKHKKGSSGVIGD